MATSEKIFNHPAVRGAYEDLSRFWGGCPFIGADAALLPGFDRWYAENTAGIQRLNATYSEALAAALDDKG